MLQKTPLNALHHEANARMVDFAGWEMPLNYGSQVEEHHAVRRDAGLFDVSHMLPVDVRGRGAREFLRRLLANSIDKAATPGRAIYSCMLNESGGVIDDLIAYHFTPERYRLVVNAATAGKDLAWMERESGQFAVDVAPRRDLALLAVQGPNARARAWAALPEIEAATRDLMPFSAAEIGDLLVARTGYTGEDGFEIMLPALSAPDAWRRLVAAGARPAGLGARDTLRLEAGMNLYGADMDESVTPLDCGLGWTVDLSGDREFTGKAALQAAGRRHSFLGLKLEDRGVLRSHQVVRTARGSGETTSGGFSPTLNVSIAFARLPKDTAAGEDVTVDVRGKWLKAKTVQRPFVRQGKALV